MIKKSKTNAEPLRGCSTLSRVQSQGHSDAGSHVPKVMPNLTVFCSALRDTSKEELVCLGDGHGPVPAVWEHEGQKPTTRERQN